jgi:hypothetical protein
MISGVVTGGSTERASPSGKSAPSSASRGGDESSKTGSTVLEQDVVYPEEVEGMMAELGQDIQGKLFLV